MNQFKKIDHLFTTKTVGKETRLVVVIAKPIIVEKHSGSIHINSTFRQGKKFIISLPIKDEARN